LIDGQCHISGSFIKCKDGNASKQSEAAEKFPEREENAASYQRGRSSQE
jgi:hypothetical protein